MTVVITNGNCDNIGDPEYHCFVAVGLVVAKLLKIVNVHGVDVDVMWDDVHC